MKTFRWSIETGIGSLAARGDLESKEMIHSTRTLTRSITAKRSRLLQSCSRGHLAFQTQIAKRYRCSAGLQAAAKEVVSTEKAPGAVGPYSQAVKTGNLVFLSGQVGLVPGTKNLVAQDVEGQTEQVMQNLGAVLGAAGSSYSQVVKTTVLLTSMSDFAAVNAIYGRYFSENPPARACFAVKELPLGAKVEVEAVATA